MLEKEPEIAADKSNKQVIFKNYAMFTECMMEINNR